MQRIFKYGDIQKYHFTPDKELNVFVYWTPFRLRHHIQKLCTFKMARFFGPPCSFSLFLREQTQT